MNLTIPKSLELDIMNFVRVNEIEDVNNFLVNCLRDGYNIMKYGTSPQENFKNENKPLKIEEYDTNNEKSDSERVEAEQKKRIGRPKKGASTNKESSEQVEEREEPIKPKKKIQIIKN